jgi:hypothetical protein
MSTSMHYASPGSLWVTHTDELALRTKFKSHAHAERMVQAALQNRYMTALHYGMHEAKL